MRRAAVVAVTLLWVLACAEEKPKPVSEPGEKLYTVRGVILSRDAVANSVHMDHEAIPGFMEAMRMDYNVRGADVARLPPDGKRVEARLHVTDRSYWITDVRAIP
jgi:protein SCO1/2